MNLHPLIACILPLGNVGKLAGRFTSVNRFHEVRVAPRSQSGGFWIFSGYEITATIYVLRVGIGCEPSLSC